MMRGGATSERPPPPPPMRKALSEIKKAEAWDELATESLNETRTPCEHIMRLQCGKNIYDDFCIHQRALIFKIVCALLCNEALDMQFAQTEQQRRLDPTEIEFQKKSSHGDLFPSETGKQKKRNPTPTTIHPRYLD